MSDAVCPTDDADERLPDVSPERIRALVAARVPLALLADLAGRPTATAAQILREEALDAEPDREADHETDRAAGHAAP